MMLRTGLPLVLSLIAFGCETSRTNEPDPVIGAPAGSRRTATSSVSSFQTSPAASLSAADRDFVRQAISGNIFEVESSRLALNQKLDSGTRNFVQRMIDDHSRANAELQAIAARKQVPGAADMTAGHQRHLDELRTLSGRAFIDRYFQLQLQAHQDAVRLFETAVQNVQDNDLRGFAQRTLPTLREHLNRVRQRAAGDQPDAAQ